MSVASSRSSWLVSHRGKAVTLAVAALACGYFSVAKLGIAAPATAPASQPATGDLTLFDGKSLDGWTVTDFAGHAEPRVEEGKIIVPMGETLSGVSFAGKLPKANYEVTLDAQRILGSDFFCGLTVPVNETYCSLIVGGWGGGVCGISNIDGNDAARNDTSSVHKFDKGKWYHIRFRVLSERLEAWIDDDQIVNVAIKGKTIAVRAEVEPSRPFGISSYQTTAGLKNIRVHPLTPKEIAADAEENK